MWNKFLLKLDLILILLVGALGVGGGIYFFLLKVNWWVSVR